MNKNFSFVKYRAILGDGDEKAFTIVTVQQLGTISWEAITEQEFSDAQYDDLPEDLFAQVNGAYNQLNFSDDDIADEIT